MQLCAVFPDDRAECWRITALAAQRFHEHGNPRWMLDQQGQQALLAIGALIPPIAAREVHDPFVGGMVAVIAAIAMEAGTIARRQARGKAPTLGSRGRHQTVACGDAIIIERIQSPPERLIMERLGVDQQGCQESRWRLVLEKPRPEREWLVHTAKAVEDHRLHGIARGHEPRCWRVPGGTVNDLTNAEGIAHTRDQAQMG
jgi:hypothetical protein